MFIVISYDSHRVPSWVVTTNATHYARSVVLHLNSERKLALFENGKDPIQPTGKWSYYWLAQADEWEVTSPNQDDPRSPRLVFELDDVAGRRALTFNAPRLQTRVVLPYECDFMPVTVLPSASRWQVLMAD